MKKFGKALISLLCVAFMAVPVLAACNDSDGGGDDGELKDYASELHLDMNSETKKQEVTVRIYIDGDTTHFNPVTKSTLTPYNSADFADTYGYMKARYLGVNTPESTGDVEKWGKTASNFTHSKLESATSIIVESDTDKWNIDSTGERYTLWIWYKTAEMDEYRNLNIELLQGGYARPQAPQDTRYGEIAMAAYMQAFNNKIRVFSDDPDPNFYEGEAYNLTLKKLRCNIAAYEGKTVRVEGVVTTQSGQNYYIEDYDEESNLYFGIAIYVGYQPSPTLRKVLTIGNRVSVHGTISYYEAGDTYQINGVDNNAFHPEYTTNTVVVPNGEGTGVASYKKVSPADITTGTHTLTYTQIKMDDQGHAVTDENGEDVYEEITVTLSSGEAAMDTTVSLENLYVSYVTTTDNGGENDGAMSLHCTAGGQEITIRTTVFKENDVLVTAERYEGKTINVKGIVEKFYGNYQVKVNVIENITVLN